MEFKGETLFLFASFISRINRIRLEFKVYTIAIWVNSIISINRIRLEFKGATKGAFNWIAWSINRIRLEFKVGYDWRYVIANIVLIESDWNLKDDPIFAESPDDPVLIESDWNLKGTKQCFRNWHWKSINRIRLEFKVSRNVLSSTLGSY